MHFTEGLQLETRSILVAVEPFYIQDVHDLSMS